MNFYDYAASWRPAAKDLRYSDNAQVAIPALLNNRKLRDGHWRWRRELEWLQDARPYYDLYPSIQHGLTRLNLDIPCEQLQIPVPVMVIRCAKGNGLLDDADRELRTIMVSESNHVRDTLSDKIIEKGWLLIADFGERERHDFTRTMYPSIVHLTFPNRVGDSVEDMVNKYIGVKTGHEALVEDAVTAMVGVVKIFAGICLLRDNLDLIEPQVLSKDQAAYDETRDASLVEKAIQHGKRAWAVGRHLTTAPGFRRPHFGFRWTGTGKTAKKLVPIKGCIVKRQLIGEVPTGYLDDLEKNAKLS